MNFSTSCSISLQIAQLLKLAPSLLGPSLNVYFKKLSRLEDVIKLLIVCRQKKKSEKKSALNCTSAYTQHNGTKSFLKAPNLNYFKPTNSDMFSGLSTNQSHLIYVAW